MGMMVGMGLAGPRNPSWKGGKITFTCKACGKEGKTFPSQPKVSCNRKCFSVIQTRDTGPSNPNWRGGRATVNCLACGKDFLAQRNAVKPTYCSKECFVVGEFRDMSRPRWLTKFGSHTKAAGKREDLGGLFVRSTWEANYARYLNFLKRCKQIEDWKYEVDTFQYAEIKRGSRFYTPDFRIHNLDGSFEYHEVKGYMDQRSATKIKRFRKRFPLLKLVVVGKSEYAAIAKQFSNALPMWEKPRRSS